jgi:predicted RNA binding protein YcfA (HicA-like mRNA interferase family)
MSSGCEEVIMNTSQALRLLTRQGWRVLRKGKGSHLIVQKGNRVATLPWRSGQKQLAPWIMHELIKNPEAEDR